MSDSAHRRSVERRRRRSVAIPRYRQFPKSDDLDVPKKPSRPAPLVSTSLIGVALALIALIAFVVWLLVMPPA
jgi:hypothetical protein